MITPLSSLIGSQLTLHMYIHQQHMAMQSWSLLSRLRKAVNKVKFLLNFNIQRWRLAASMVSRAPRRLSFGDRPGLKACIDNDNDDEQGLGSRGGSLQRTTSFPLPSTEDDIDKRAEMFIANFHRQLQIERQISLELQYCRGHSFDYSP